MITKNNEVSTRMGKAVAIVCFLSNLSQLPIFVSLQLSSAISILIWICFAAYILLEKGTLKVTGEFLPFLMVMLIYLTYLGVAELFLEKKYLSSEILYPFVLSMFIMCLGNNIGNRTNEKDLYYIFTSYVLSALIVGLNIFFEYLMGADITAREYAYGSKNSISQILLTAAILGLFYMVPTLKIRGKIIHVIIALFLGLVVIFLKSRATIIAIPFICLFAFIFGSEKDKKFRLKIFLLGAVAVIYVLSKPDLYDSLVNDIILGGRESDSLDDISSGRWKEWQNFFTDLGDNWLLGNGRIKRESLILTAILEYGIPMGLTIIIVAITPLRFAVLHLKSKKRVVVVLFYVALCYFLNSIFEQLAPFGPGVKCYFMWLLFGILLSQK